MKNPMDEESRVLAPLRPGPGQKCHAHNRAGKPCGRWAIPGGTVCTAHGGGASQVREAARRRMLQFAPKAIRVLEEIARDPSAPANARVRAAADLLDRSGLRPATELAVTEAPATNAALDAAITAALAARAQGTDTV